MWGRECSKHMRTGDGGGGDGGGGGLGGGGEGGGGLGGGGPGEGGGGLGGGAWCELTVTWSSWFPYESVKVSLDPYAAPEHTLTWMVSPFCTEAPSLSSLPLTMSTIRFESGTSDVNDTATVMSSPRSEMVITAPGTS